MTQNQNGQVVKQDQTPFLWGMDSPLKTILGGLIFSSVVSVGLYVSVLRKFSVYATGDLWLGTLFAMVFAFGAFCLLMTMPGIQEGKPQHRRVLKFLGDYRERCLPAGNAWVPPFCGSTEVNIGEQMIDMRDTEVLIDNNRKAELHLQMQLRVYNSFKYVQALASLGMPIKPTFGDAVIEAVVSKVKEAVRLKCTDFKEYEELNKTDSKQQIIESVTANDKLNVEVADWGVKIKDLFVRTVILPKDVLDAANLPEIEARQREAETLDVQTLVKLGSVIRNGYVEIGPNKKPRRVRGFGQNISPEKLLTATQVQQKRVQGIAMSGGRGIAMVDDKKGA